MINHINITGGYRHGFNKVLSVVKSKKTGFFAAGVLFGTAGIKALSSKDAKKLYTNATAAVLRAKECVMDTVTTVQENAEDIYEEAKQINEDRAAAEEEMELTLKLMMMKKQQKKFPKMLLKK